MSVSVQSSDTPGPDANEPVDLVCIGGGAGGLSAAVCARAMGLTVLLLEKADEVGGATAFSGGAIWAPGNALMPGGDDLDAARAYLRGVLGNAYDAAKIDAYLAHVPEMLAFLEARSLVRFGGLQSPDYYPEHAGASRGRTIMATTFDARRLGRRLSLMRRPLAPLTLGGMQFEMQDLATLQAALRSPRGLVRSAAMIGRFLVGRLRFGRDPRLVRGNALVGRLLASALETGVDIRTRCAIGAISQMGDGSGFEIQTMWNGRKGRVRARKVVLATGGFGANGEWMSLYAPQDGVHLTMQPDENTGDGIALATTLGGRMATGNAAPAIWSPISEAVVGGRVIRFPHLMMDRLKPGSIMIAPDGRRFVNEGRSYQDVVDAMHRKKVSVAYLVADREFVKTYGLGLVRPAPFSPTWALRSGYLIKADSLEQLAERLGVPTKTFVETVARFNSFARAGVDEDFARGDDAYSRHHGEAAHQPNPGLGEIRHGPFFAIELFSGDLGTVEGLRTDARARVLDGSDAPIPGLYACGADMNSIMSGHYPGGGTSIGAAMTFAYIAARDMAAELETPHRKAS